MLTLDFVLETTLVVILFILWGVLIAGINLGTIFGLMCAVDLFKKTWGKIFNA
jgi:hypothetical protein